MSKKSKDINNDNTDVSQTTPQQKKKILPKIIGIFLAVVFLGLLLLGGYYLLYNPDGLESGTYYLDEDGVQNGQVWIKISKTSRSWSDNSGNKGRYVLSEDKQSVSFKQSGTAAELFTATISDTEDERSISVTVDDETFKYILGELKQKQDDDELYFDENPLFAQKFTVTFDPNGGTGENLDPQQIIKGRFIIFPELTREQNEYVSSWIDQEGNTVTSFTRVLSDLSLTAQWDRELNVIYNLNYVKDEQDEPETLATTTQYGKAEYVPERAGYVFTGWWYSEKLDTAVRGKVVIPEGKEEPLTLYAEWAIDTGEDNKIDPPVIEVRGGVLYWESANGATGYVIKISRSDGFETTRVIGSPSVAGSDISWTFPAEELGAGTYEVRVYAEGNGTGMNNSATVVKLIVK